MDRRTTLMLLSMVALAAVIGSTVLTVYAADNAGWLNGRMTWGACGQLSGWRHGKSPFRFVEVSEEYQQNVVNIALADADVKALLDQGYNITGVRPIITTRIDAEGNVVMKATNATVMLQKDTTGWASISVDVQGGKVTRIVVLTRTVIEKS
ncbi:MAG: hypothetical protein QW057_06480 [Candidatus Bathyarchaeia archaeon]